MSLTTHHIISHSTGFSNPRTCTVQIWFHPRDFLCMFISSGLASPKWSPAWPTPRLKLSRVLVHRVTICVIWLKMGLCADTGYVQSASFSLIYFSSNLLKSGVFVFGITLISDGVLSIVSWLNLFMGNINVAVCASLPWGLATWRESVEADCQSAIYKATRPSAFVGGFSAHWHSSWDSKPCWPWRHSLTLIILSSCSLVAFLSKGFGGALQKIANQGCFNARLATTKLSRDSAVLYPCTNRLKNSTSILNVMNSINCTPANQLYCCMIPDSHWTPAGGLVVRGCLLCPVFYTPTHHT